MAGPGRRNGAGSGGAGHQRAIDNGLPPGETGPTGSPNNPQPAPKPQDDTMTSSAAEAARAH